MSNDTSGAVASNAELGKLYADRDHAAQGEHYMRHIDAMTRENLYRKSAIAGELAHRDIEIARLRAALAESCDEHRAQIYDSGPGGGCPLLADAVAAERERWKDALRALRSLRNCISTFDGHGMPGFTDRGMALLALDAADKVLGSSFNAMLSGPNGPQEKQR